MTDASPLSEASPDSLEELFRRDPLKLSSQDIDRVIAELRRKRGLWAASEAEGKAAPRSKAAKPKATELSIDDLGDLL